MNDQMCRDVYICSGETCEFCIFKTYWPDTFGGIERTIHAIVKGSDEHGIASDVLSLSAKPQENTRSFDGHMAYKAKLDIEFASTGLSRDVFSRFRELSNRADIIHYHFPADERYRSCGTASRQAHHRDLSF